ncbi:hypothetical protein [Jidongwangia harbinensis]|uniref:hypothetical protein n=1 Tax=Jidongwangia harbinensis TaxID=2878561 RepID=UPI001CDA387F|nr:hypothetical protein [Jidongwangia harbinensis]MCA2213965.1 hypothetical protein [Jidongwangia harbinensis]
MTAVAAPPGPARRPLWQEPGWGLRPARLTVESALLGLVAGIAVVAPWTQPGYLLLLDWVAGPNHALTPGLYGLDPAALDALPYRLATHALRNVVGPGATGWLMVLCYFPVAAAGVSALAAGGRWRRHPAALFVCVNPFVIERIQAGHVPFLLSVALLCVMTGSAVRARRRARWFAARPAGWYALAMSVGPHAAWLGGAALLAVALLPRPRRRHLVRTAATVVSAGCIYAYAIAVTASAILTVRVGTDDLEVYAPHAGPGGMLVTLTTLRGFWRGGADSSPQVVLGLAPAAVMLLAAVYGLARLCRRDPVVGRPLAALTAAGLLLGAGIHGPLEPVYRAAFDVVPLFTAMREQQKWVALAMIGYAIGIGATVEAAAAACRAARPPVSRIVAVATLLAVGGMHAAVAPSLIWGLGGTVRVSHYPKAWYDADRLMGNGTESVLFLPWHLYQPFSFTRARTVATPAGAFFRRPVISSDAVELGPVQTNSSSLRMAYLHRVLAAGGTGRFGRLVAPLGVRYVALARERETEEYAWLARQTDLRRVLRTPQLDLYRVEANGTGRVLGARAGDGTSVMARAARGGLGTEAVLPGGPAQRPLPSKAYGGIRRLSSTSWRVDPGTPGWVVIPEEWSPGWAAEDLLTRRTAAGTVAVRVGIEPITLRYTPWRWLRLGLAASLLSLALLVVAGLNEHRRDLPYWFTYPGSKE